MVQFVAEVIPQFVQPPMTATQYFIITLMGGIPTLLVALLAFWKGLQNRTAIADNTKKTIETKDAVDANTTKTEETHKAVNGRMEEQLRLASEAAYAKGMLEGKAQAALVAAGHATGVAEGKQLVIEAQPATPPAAPTDGTKP